MIEEQMQMLENEIYSVLEYNSQVYQAWPENYSEGRFEGLTVQDIVRNSLHREWAKVELVLDKMVLENRVVKFQLFGRGSWVYRIVEGSTNPAEDVK